MRLGLFIALLLTRATAHAAEVLTWDDCLQRARENNPGLVSARESVAAAEAAVRAAQAGARPQLALNGSASQVESDRATAADQSYRAALDVDQLLYDGGNTRSLVRSAEAERASARASAQQSGAEISFRLRSAFIDLLHAQSRIGLLEQIRARRADNVEMVELRYLGGQEHQGSLALNQASLKEAELELRQAGRNLATARAVLARSMGWPEETSEWSVTGRPPQANAPDSYDLTALARATPNYASAEAARARAEARLQNARSGNRPTLNAFGSAERSGEGVDMENEQLSAGLRISFPFWSGGRTGAQIQQAAADRAAAEAAVADAYDQQRAALEQALQAWRNAGETVSVQQDFVSALELRATIAREQYGNGLLAFDNWDIIENDLIERQKNLLETRRSALLAEAAWQRVCGRNDLADDGGRP